MTNLKKTYQSLLDLSFPELGQLMELDGVGLRALLIQAPTPGAIARKRRSTLEQDWKLRPKAAALKALAADSMADPELSAASAPALQSILQALSEMEARLHALDTQIDRLSEQNVDPQSRALLRTIPGFGPTIAAKALAYLPHQILHAGSRPRHTAIRYRRSHERAPRQEVVRSGNEPSGSGLGL